MFVFFRHVPTGLNVLITVTSYDELLLIIVTSDFIYQLQECRRPTTYLLFARNAFETRQSCGPIFSPVLGLLSVSKCLWSSEVNQ